MINSNLTESEAKIQADCYQWFHNSYPHLRGLLYHVPNGEKRSIQTAQKLKAMGVVPGVPDVPFHYKGNSYFFEFKKPKSGKASKEQEKIHKLLADHNFIVWLPESLKEFQYLIKGIIEYKDPVFTKGVTKEDFYYKYKIFDYLYKLGDAELVLISDICEEDTQDRFINIVSEFMNENYDLLDKFDLLFTPDFKAIYKKVYGSDQEIIYKGSSIV